VKLAEPTPEVPPDPGSDLIKFLSAQLEALPHLSSQLPPTLSVPGGRSPSSVPSHPPSSIPSLLPSALPSVLPSALPSVLPSSVPALLPSSVPSLLPSSVPSLLPSSVPSLLPSSPLLPFSNPSVLPHSSSSFLPQTIPSLLPSSVLAAEQPVIHPMSVQQAPKPSDSAFTREHRKLTGPQFLRVVPALPKYILNIFLTDIIG
jgi:hypothetical protein